MRPKVLGNPVTISEFEGWWNPGDSGIIDPNAGIPDAGFIQAYNVLFTNQKKIRARKGIQAINNNDYQSLGILGIYNGDLVFKHNSGVKRVNPSTGVEGTIDGANTAALMLEYNDIAYLFYATSGNIRTWNGATTTLTATALNYQASVGVNFKSRFWVVPNELTTIANSQVRYTDIFAINAPNTASGWSNGGTIDVASDDGDFITGLVVLNDVLIIFKRQSTWALYVSGSPSTWTLRNLHPQIGSIGGKTCKVIGGLIYFQATNGVYRTDGTTFEKLSGNVDADFKQPPGVVSATVCNLRSATWWQNYYCLQAGNPSGILDFYNIDTGAWSRWLCLDYDLQTPFWYEVGNSSDLFFVDYKPSSATGRVVKYLQNLPSYFDGNSGSTQYQCQLTSKFLDFDQPAMNKMIREVDIDCNLKWDSSPINQSFSMNINNDKQYLDTRTDGMTGDVNNTYRNLFRFRGPMRTRTFQFDLTWYPSVEMEINSITFDVGVVGRVGYAR